MFMEVIQKLNLVLDSNNKDMDEKSTRMSFLYIYHSLFNYHNVLKFRKCGDLENPFSFYFC